MKKSRFAEEQIIRAPNLADIGKPVVVVGRTIGMSQTVPPLPENYAIC